MYQADHLYSPRLELILQFRECAEFCCADGSEICWVREQDTPFVAEELMEIDVAVSCLRLEIGC